MLIAGEPSGDLLAAELVQALREQFATAKAVPTPDYQPLEASLEPRFFGVGGPCLAKAGVEMAFDLTEHSVIGLSDVLIGYGKFRRLFGQLFSWAQERQPDAIICVDFSGFNRRFAHAIRRYTTSRADWFHDWQPKIIQYVSPQVWASRPGRAQQMARDYDLLLSILPFEQEWYEKHTSQLRVEFVGHPIIDRYAATRAPVPPVREQSSRPSGSPAAPLTHLPTHAHASSTSPTIVLLPGSRLAELRRHLPVMLRTVELMRVSLPDLRARVVLPNEGLVREAQAARLPEPVQVRAGGLAPVLSEADLAIASTGTVTLECAYFGVPTVAIYKTSWSTYQIAKRIVKVKYLAMPNLLADEELFPEFIQGAATPERIANTALELAGDEARRARIKGKLAEVVAMLGSTGASRRAAQAIVDLLQGAEHGAP